MKVVATDAQYQRSLAAAGGVMVFGHDATIALFRQRLASRAAQLTGFGTASAGAVVAGPPTATAVAAVVKDIVSLVGQGCLACRFVACADEVHAPAWLAALDKALAPYRLQEPAGQSPAFAREVAGRWLLQGFEAYSGWGPWRLLTTCASRARLRGEALTIATGDMIPVWAGSPASVTALAGLKKLALAPALSGDEHWTPSCSAAGIELCPLGELNANPVTGRHLGTKLF